MVTKEKRQKKIAVINDISGFGRCSIAVSMPIISAMKMQSCLLPTSIFSAHTGFPGFVFTDYTKQMEPHMNHWKELELSFDGIMTGFLGSKQQIEIVGRFIREFKKKDTLVVVDPIMGDYGKLYPTYTEEICDKMKHLVELADIVTPNLTEACRLVDRPYIEGWPKKEELYDICKKIAAIGPKYIVITGIAHENSIINYVYEDGKDSLIENPKIGDYRSGTGDVFSAIITGEMVKKYPAGDLEQSVKKAADFIVKCMEYTNELEMPLNCGLCFEEYLWELGKPEGWEEK